MGRADVVHGLSPALAHNDNPDVLGLNPIVAVTEMLDTQQLLEAARGGDTEAFCELCLSVEARLLRQAVSLCNDVSRAEDLVQETLLEAWKYLRRFNGQCQFFTWLCAILLNRHRNNLRKNRLLFFSAFTNAEEKTGSGHADPVERFTDAGPWPDQAAEQEEDAALVRKCVLALPGKHQQVIYLRFYVDDSLEGIAAAVGCSVGTVKSRLFHGLEKLRRMKELSAQYETSK